MSKPSDLIDDLAYNLHNEYLGGVKPCPLDNCHCQEARSETIVLKQYLDKFAKLNPQLNWPDNLTESDDN